MRVGTLIVGQGLAGSLLARRLAESGSVLVVDPAESNASQVAAGLMTPLTGRKFRLTPEYPRLFARALEVYRPLGVLSTILVYRMFADAEQRCAGVARALDPDCAPFVDQVTDAAGQLDADLADSLGGVLMRGAWVDLPRLLEDSRAWLAGRLLRDRVVAREMEDCADSVRWKGIQADRVVWCDGWRAMLPGGLWSDVPWQPAKGEALDLVSDAPEKSFVLNREGWALPLGGGRWRTGTNWDWAVQDEIPTAAQREKLSARFVSYFAAAPTVDITGHVAGVRPCTRDNRPCVGQHATRTRHFLLNGLGPRGTVWAPTAIDALVGLMEGGTPVPAELAVGRLVAV
jgi:glycine/D-amino acid oxidase-like deaminating enzyme